MYLSLWIPFKSTERSESKEDSYGKVNRNRMEQERQDDEDREDQEIACSGNENENNDNIGLRAGALDHDEDVTPWEVLFVLCLMKTK